MGNFYEPTGIELVDSIRGLQVTADQIDDPNAKIAHVRSTLAVIGAAELLGSSFMIDAAEAWGKRPDDPPKDLIHINRRLLFIARLSAFGYLFDPSVPVDTLSLNFEEPELWGADSRGARTFREMNLRVPVLAIESCILAKR